MTKDECKKVVLDIIADIAPDEDLSNVKADVRLRDQLHELRSDISIATTEFAALAAGAEDDTRDALHAGDVLAGRYEVVGVIGRGGMGVVYQARDRELDEEVAVKMLRRELLSGDEAVLERFKTEIRLARRGRLGVSSTLALARQLVDALTVAHAAGVIHRDVKPENALLDGDGVLKVMDFGIARLAERSSTTTQAGMIVGTPAYMAPEQLVGEGEIDAISMRWASSCTSASPGVHPSRLRPSCR